jgi:hypothetical protein
MANLFLHRMPIVNGVKFTIICSNDLADTIDEFLQDCFEIEVMQSGKKITLRSETRFEVDIEDNEKIDSLSKVFASEKSLTQALFGVEIERNFPSELIDNICVN